LFNKEISMSTVQSGGELGRDEFLKLFTYQLKNQDPMNPMDSAAFSSQLAQFSSLEQLYNSNEKLSELVSYQRGSLVNDMSASLLGNKVVLQDGTEGIVVGIGLEGANPTLILDDERTFGLNEIKEVHIN
jgi:flagellar basal-body rod modification protein FlgD